MIKIDDIIELKTNRKTERLSFATRYLVQINFTFDLTVLSDNFSGTSHFCVRREQLEQLCSDLTTMKQTLSGDTILEDNDSDASLNFQIKQNGQVIVFGQVGGSHDENFLNFKFQTDQTCIEPLVTDFHNLLKFEEPANLYDAIDLILWNDWDPIGINDIAPRDEYKSYVPEIFGLVKAKAGRQEIAKRLFKLETDNMGMSGTFENCLRIADKILDASGDREKSGV